MFVCVYLFIFSSEYSNAFGAQNQNRGGRGGFIVCPLRVAVSFVGWVSVGGDAQSQLLVREYIVGAAVLVLPFLRWTETAQNGDVAHSGVKLLLACSNAGNDTEEGTKNILGSETNAGGVAGDYFVWPILDPVHPTYVPCIYVLRIYIYMFIRVTGQNCTHIHTEKPRPEIVFFFCPCTWCMIRTLVMYFEVYNFDYYLRTSSCVYDTYACYVLREVYHFESFVRT